MPFTKVVRLAAASSQSLEETSEQFDLSSEGADVCLENREHLRAAGYAVLYESRADGNY